MKKKVLVIFLLAISIACVANAQIKNTFIRKEKFVLYPALGFSKDINNQKTYRIRAEIGYLPFDRFELRSGIRYSFGNQHAFMFSLSTRYYLLKSRFTFFPEMNTWGIYNIQEKKTLYFYNTGIGIAYYGILKRLGIDLVINYDPPIHIFYPTMKLKILLGKIDKE